VLLPSTDMPFTESGIQPDIIINPCCIPSRMTVGQLFECVFSKVAALRGEMIDATPFNNFDFNTITKELKEYGFDEHGYEHMYCGMTGKKILSKIFMGPTFYLRLKHMVQDKIHCLTMDHEIFTLDGWKTFDELNDNDYIYSYNIINTQSYFVPIQDKIIFEEYQGKMYHIEKLGQTITHDHSMLIKYNLDDNYDLVKIQNIQYPAFFKGALDDIYIERNDVHIYDAENVRVFCLRVKYGTFTVRKVGMKLASWTGNSRATGPKQRLTRQPPEGTGGCQWISRNIRYIKH